MVLNPQRVCPFTFKSTMLSPVASEKKCFFGCFLSVFRRLTILSNINNPLIVLWFKVFLSDTNDFIVSSNCSYLIVVTYWNTVISFNVSNNNFCKQLLLHVAILNTNNLHSYWASLYEKGMILNRSIWPIDGILTGPTNPGPRRKDYERLLPTSQSSTKGVYTLDVVFCHTKDTNVFCFFCFFFAVGFLPSAGVSQCILSLFDRGKSM